MSVTASTHKCLVCNTELIPVYRALCRYCFAAVPWRMRADVLHAWRLRDSKPDRCNQVVAALHRWVERDSEYGGNG